MTIKVYDANMGVEIDETIRGTDGSKVDYKWYVTGTSLYNEARSAIYAAVSDTFDALFLKKIRLIQTGLEVWEAKLAYSDLITSSIRFSFDTTGNTARVTHGYSETRYGPAGLGDPNVPPMDGALNVIDGKVEGTEITIPGLKFSVTRSLPKWFLNDSYVEVLENLTGSTNLNPYLGRPAQALLFLGATGGQQGQGNPEVTYHFVAGQYRTLAVGAITGIVKRPHQFMWPDWANDEDTTAKRLRKRCRGVYLNDVIPILDWDQLTPPPEGEPEPT